MAYDPRQFVVRQPRHSAVDESAGVLWLEVISEPAGERRDVVLVDFSRKGAKLELSLPVAPNSAVLLHIENESQGLAISLAGHVRWQRVERVGCWALGCMFDEEVPYETIGELFLSGVLSTT